MSGPASSGLTVVKLGGAALKHSLSDPATIEVLTRPQGPLIIVHGGGPEISQYCAKLGLEATFLDGQRVTSVEVLGVVEMALARIGNTLVRGFGRAGRKGLALNGQSLGLFVCDEENPRLGRVGRIRQFDGQALTTCLEKGWVPIVAPLGIFAADTRFGNEACNINADLAAAHIAAQLKADRLVFFTDRDGILDAQGDLIRELDLETLKSLADSPTISGGMKVKARAIVETLAEHPACSVQVVNGVDLKVFSQALDAGGFGTTISNRNARS